MGETERAPMRRGPLGKRDRPQCGRGHSNHCGSLRRRQSGPGGGPLCRSRAQARRMSCRKLCPTPLLPGTDGKLSCGTGVRSGGATRRFVVPQEEDGHAGRARMASKRHRKRCLGGTGVTKRRGNSPLRRAARSHESHRFAKEPPRPRQAARTCPTAGARAPRRKTRRRFRRSVGGNYPA